MFFSKIFATRLNFISGQNIFLSTAESQLMAFSMLAFFTENRACHIENDDLMPRWRLHEISRGESTKTKRVTHWEAH